MSSIKRFYIFTGKGGVGKTILSFAFSRHLYEQGKKVYYVNFERPSLKGLMIQNRNFDYETLDLIECSQGYIARKLNSKIIASWVIKTPFFRSLLSMVPGFNYLIYLGYIVEKLNEDSDLIAVLDAPSSGHCLTMLDSLYNFEEIFKSGSLYQDIQSIRKFIHNSHNLKINICTLPTQMSLHEAEELKQKISELDLPLPEIFVNNSLNNVIGLPRREDLPEFLKQKMDMEQEVLKGYEGQIKASLPHISSLEYGQIIDELVPLMVPFE